MEERNEEEDVVEEERANDEAVARNLSLVLEVEVRSPTHVSCPLGKSPAAAAGAPSGAPATSEDKGLKKRPRE